MRLEHVRHSIRAFRDLIHAADPPHEPPFQYMNIDHPLTPLKHEFVEGQIVPRIAALRHALYLLDIAESRLFGIDKMEETYREGKQIQAYAAVNVVGGILWMYGIDSSRVDERLAA